MTFSFKGFGRLRALAIVMLIAMAAPLAVFAQEPAAAAAVQAGERPAGGEANLVLPDLSQVDVGGYNGRTLLTIGIGVAVLGLLFGLVILNQLKNLPVHRTMREVSELIYETCKTYLITQGKFILLLEVFIGAIMVVYFGFLRHFDAMRVLIILFFSVVGILGSYSVAWFGIRVNTYANSRTAFASLEGRPYPVYALSLIHI